MDRGGRVEPGREVFPGVPGNAEGATNENLASLLAWAARGETPSSSVIVRPTNTFGVRYWARVGPCGPPNAALLVLADAR